MGSEEKLTKKQKKALEFRTKRHHKDEPEQQDNDDKKKIISEPESKDINTTSGEPLKKKRKTRRGKGGKKSGPKFILFVGNLPYDTTEDELLKFFKSSKPDIIRLRPDKGIAFLEFMIKDNTIKDENETSKQTNTGNNLRSKMDIALSKHHSIFKNRKINVELTAGGGGNSQNRLAKIKEKNVKMDEERRVKISKSKEIENNKRKEREAGGNEFDKLSNNSAVSKGIHPSRLKLMGKQ